MLSLAMLMNAKSFRGSRDKNVKDFRRGRQLAVTAALLVGLTAGLCVHLWVVKASARSISYVYTVAPGDTVWSIASRITKGADPRAMMREIIDQNHLNAAGAIVVGEVLKLPGKPPA